MRFHVKCALRLNVNKIIVLAYCVSRVLGELVTQDADGDVSVTMSEDKELMKKSDDFRVSTRDSVRNGGKLFPKREFKATAFLNVTCRFRTKGVEQPAERSNCTGALVSPEWVLTAAHCVCRAYLYRHLNKKQDGRYTDITIKFTVRAGNNDLFNAFASHLGQIRETKNPGGPENVVAHPQAVIFGDPPDDIVRYVMDVALLKVETPFEMDDEVQMTSLMRGPMPDMFPRRCIANGFGAHYRQGTDAHPVIDGKLYSEEVTVGNKTFCEKLTGTKEWREEQFLCTHDPSDLRRAVCQGDSGSPLYCPEGNELVSVGVLSDSAVPTDCEEREYDEDYVYTGLIEGWVREVTGDRVVFKGVAWNGSVAREGVVVLPRGNGTQKKRRLHKWFKADHRPYSPPKSTASSGRRESDGDVCVIGMIVHVVVHVFG